MFDPYVHEAQLRAWNRQGIETKIVHELSGIAAMVVFDGIVDDHELAMLTGWLDRNRHLCDRWPLNDLAGHVQHVIDEGLADPEDRHVLANFLASIAAGVEPGAPGSDGLCEEHPSIVFPRHSFAFTGKLQLGRRSKAAGMVEALGGIVRPGVSKLVDFVVIGDLGADAWKFSRYGTKIQKAKDLQQAGHQIVLVSEADFCHAVIDDSIARRITVTLRQK